MTIVNEFVMQIGSNKTTARKRVMERGKERKSNVNRMVKCKFALNNAERKKKNAPYQIK